MTDVDPISKDEILQLLSDGQRRTVLRQLRDRQPGPVDVEELVAAIAVTSGDQGRVEAGRVATELKHHHLPKLADAGVIDYDRERGAIRYRSQRAVEEVLRFVERIETG